MTSPVGVVVGGTCTIMWDQLYQRGQDLTAAERLPGNEKVWAHFLVFFTQHLRRKMHFGHSLFHVGLLAQ